MRTDERRSPARSRRGGLDWSAFATLTAVALTGQPAMSTSAGLDAARGLHADVALAGTESWIMGGSGLPIPPPSYLTDVSERYIDPSATNFNDGGPLFSGQPEFSIDKTNPLFTPEGLYPFEGVKELEFNPSVSQGVSILDSTVAQHVDSATPGVVLGYSQSATIASMVMQHLLDDPSAGPANPADLSFVLLGDPDNPDGGLLSRFDFPGMQPLTIPSLGITFSGPTPSDTPWDTAIYTQEYDGFADFPKYPLNLLADINAVLGIAFIHGNYPTLSADQLGQAIELPTSDDYTGHTQYFMIPTENLPILDLVRAIPGIGTPIADLLQPDLKVLIDLGYGNVDTDISTDPISGGWDTGPANVGTPFELFPSNIDWADVGKALLDGAEKGWNDFLADLSDLSSTTSTTSAADGVAAGGSDSLTDIVNGFSSALSNAYSALLPTADIINALTTTVPAYDISLFSHFIEQGDVLNAVFMPVGVNFALESVAGGFELRVLENAISAIGDAFSGGSA